MTGNNKKGMGKRSEQEKGKVANGPPYPTSEDVKFLNLQILNGKLAKEITHVRKENAVLSKNLTEMRSENIESARRMTEELKETEKEFTKELERKDAKYQAAISQAGKQLLEAEERFNTAISAKEDKCKADKKNLEDSVFQLKNQIEARSAELEETNKGRKLEKDMLLSQIDAAEMKTAEISRSSQMAQEAFNAEKQNLWSTIAELQTNLELMVSEKGSLVEINRELSTEAESLKAVVNQYREKMVSMEDEKQALEAGSVSTAERLEDLRKQNATMEKEHGRKYGEYQAAISQADKQLLEAEERFNTEISAKEHECKAVNLEKKNLETTVLQLKNQIEARSAELEANNKGRKLEKDVLLSQIAAAEKQTAEISRSSHMAQEAFNAERENLLTRLAELQTNFELTVSEKGSLSETNRELTTEVESLKVHLNEYSEMLVRMEDGKKALEAMSVSKAERLEDLLKQNAAMEKEHGRKYGEYQAAISQAGKQLLEAEERFNTEISAKEDECKAVNLNKKNLETTVLQLKNQIEARSAELEANNKGRKLEKDVLLSQIVAAEKQTAEISRSSQMAQEAFNADRENLLTRLAELQTNLALTVSEKGSLSETNRELITEAESLKAHLNEYSEKLVRMEDEKKALEAMSVSKAERLEDLLKQNATMEKEHGRKYGEYQAAISQAGKQLLEAEERFNTEISAKEDECKAVNLGKKNLEATVLQLKNQIEAISAELEANNKGRKLEKDALVTQIGAAKKETAEISRRSQTAHEAFNVEKENLLSRISELQKNLELMANEKQSLNETNRELKTEGESLKAQLNKYSEKMVSMEDEKQALEAVSASKAERFEALLKHNAMMEKEISRLQQQVDENVKQHSELLKEKEEQATTVNSLRGEINSLMESVKKYKVMEEKHSKLFKEKEEQAKTVQSLRGEINSFMEESVKKYTVMEEKHSELFKEKEEQAKTVNSLRGEINSLMEYVNKYKVMEEKQSEKTINTLRGEINSLMDEKSSPSRELKETTKKHQDFPKKCIQSQHPTITPEKRTKLLDIVKHMDVHKSRIKISHCEWKANQPTKPTIVNGKQNRDNAIEKPKPTDVNEKRGMQEKRTPNGGHQSKAQKKPHFKI